MIEQVDAIFEIPLNEGQWKVTWRWNNFVILLLDKSPDSTGLTGVCWHTGWEECTNSFAQVLFWSIDESWEIFLILFHGESLKICLDSLPPSQSVWLPLHLACWITAVTVEQSFQITCQLRWPLFVRKLDLFERLFFRRLFNFNCSNWMNHNL